MRRREFLQSAGLGALVLWFRVEAQAAPLAAPRPGEYPADVNAYLRIGADGRVGCAVGKVELGQGNMTALAQLVAEELEVSPDQVDMLMGDTDLCPWDRATGGSLSLWQFGPVLRGAAAEARAALLDLAARKLQAPAGDLEMRAGAIWVKGAPARRATFGELVQGQRLERRLGPVQPKPLGACTVIGRSAPRKDALVKVTGTAQYAGDLNLPGTLHACVLRPPAHGLALASVDTAGAERLPGVRAVRDGSLVAVLHEQPDAARRALEQVKAEWGGAEPGVDSQSIYRHLVADGPQLKVAASRGDLAAGEARSAEVVEGEYRNAYVGHATIEPHTALARWEGGRMTVWASTQAPFRIRTDVAQALGLEARQVRVITPYVGGGFGGKLVGPDAVEAARLARLVPGRPVQLAWGRQEDFFLDTFRPAAVIKLRSGLGKDGYVTFWDYQVYGIDQNEAEYAYDFPAARYLATGSSGGTPGLHPFQIGAWRGTLVVTMAQVAVDKGTGRIRVERVLEALDLGLVVNPDGARQQVEGAITMALGYSLAEEVRFQGGRILDQNFDTYRIPLFSWLPRIDVVLADNPDLPPQGLGEPPVVAVGPALANAVFDAAGARVCHLPMTAERVLEALKG